MVNEEYRNLFVVVHPSGYWIMDTLSIFPFYAEDSFRYSQLKWYHKLLDIRPKPWYYYEKLGYYTIQVKLLNQRFFDEYIETVNRLGFLNGADYTLYLQDKYPTSTKDLNPNKVLINRLRDSIEQKYQYIKLD